MADNLYLDIYYNNDKNEKIKLDVNLDMINTKVVFDRKVLIGNEIDKEKERSVFEETSDYAERIRNAVVEKGEKVDDSYVIKIENDVEIIYDSKSDFLMIDIYDDNMRYYWKYELYNSNAFLYRKLVNDIIVDEIYVDDIISGLEIEMVLFSQLKNYINMYILEESN